MSAAPQPQPKQHHYVHRAYLEGFVDSDYERRGESYLWAYLPNRLPFRQSPERIAKRNYYYCFDRENRRAFDVEHILQRLEDVSLPIVKKFRSRNFDVDAEERLTFAGYVALSCTRVPTFERFVNRSVLLHKALEVEKFAFDPEKMELFAREERERTGKDVSPEELRSRLTAGNTFLTQTNRGWSLGQMGQVTMALQRPIFEMLWTFLVAPNGDPGFLTSDNPVSLFGASVLGIGAAGFLNSPDAFLRFPVSREICLVAGHRGYSTTKVILGSPAKVIHASPAHVRHVNKGTISGADTQLYAPFESVKVQKLHNAAVTERGKPKRVMIKKGRVVEE